MKKTISIIIILLGSCIAASAQRMSVSTNAAEYANFATLNAEASVALARHWTFNLGFQYNPWNFPGKYGDARNQHRNIDAGVRYWFWNVYSGWWMAAKGQIEEYNRGGILGPQTEEGNAYGAGASAGYSLMIARNLNLDFGLGFWSGVKNYTVYKCPTCGKIEDQGTKAFLMPDDILLSLVFTF